LRRWRQPAVAAALDRLFACLVAGGAGAFLNALKHHVARKHGTGGLRGVFQGPLPRVAQQHRIDEYSVLTNACPMQLSMGHIFLRV
ncbi:hypothetical protein XocUg1_00320, partial [Xanthomonas oryzae pv. oryzicola]|uniref:hypothetical protein n=1 Tax=Xanthomonas oryzae TaxID=347 RepID=UPI002DE58FB9|nr:hypothetical protein [Xanthomonas oryzae pv. oryzicola]